MKIGNFCVAAKVVKPSLAVVVSFLVACSSDMVDVATTLDESVKEANEAVSF